MTAAKISAKSNENMDVVTSQALANISGNRKISGNIKFCGKFTTLRGTTAAQEQYVW